MRHFLMIGSLLLSAVLMSAANCTVPTGPGVEGEGEGPGECTVGTVTMPKPDEAPVREDAAALNLGCIGNPTVLAQSEAVTVEGCVEIFGLGGRAKRGIEVSLFSDTQNPRVDAPLFGKVSISVIADASDPNNPLACDAEDANTPACRSLDCSKEGFYRMENIPVHVPLTMKVSKPNDDTIIDTYTFGIIFDYGDALAADGVVSYEANLIYRSTYDSSPTLAGRIVDGQQEIGDGVGRGVIAGEIHDCDDKIVQGASVTSDQEDATTKITYFNGDTEDPEPQLARQSTNTDGLYVVLNATTDAGKEVHTISAGILDPACTTLTSAPADCQCVSLSSRSIEVYPDSVSIVTLRGDLPVVQ